MLHEKDLRPFLRKNEIAFDELTEIQKQYLCNYIETQVASVLKSYGAPKRIKRWVEPSNQTPNQRELLGAKDAPTFDGKQYCRRFEQAIDLPNGSQLFHCVILWSMDVIFENTRILANKGAIESMLPAADPDFQHRYGTVKTHVAEVTRKQLREVIKWQDAENRARAMSVCKGLLLRLPLSDTGIPLGLVHKLPGLLQKDRLITVTYYENDALEITDGVITFWTWKEGKSWHLPKRKLRRK